MIKKHFFKLLGRRCLNCDQYKKDFHLIPYIEGFIIMRKLVAEGRMVFFAGSCPLSELERHLEAEDLYTIEHFFKCNCGRFYYTGYCVRGRPIMRVLTEIPNNLSKTISGHYGKYFDNQ